MGRSSKLSAGSLLSNFQFGVFGVNKCDDKDDSFYCNFSRFFSMVMMTLVLCVILFIIYSFLKPIFFSSKKSR